MSAVDLAGLLSCSMTDLQPLSCSSSSHADSSGLRGWGSKQMGGSHVTNALLMCVCKARLALPIEISLPTMFISLMWQLDLFILLSNEPENNGCYGENSHALLPIQT